MHQKAYKCRVCGETFAAGIAQDPETITLDILLRQDGEQFFIHECADGHRGVADFVGCIDFEQWPPIRTLGEALGHRGNSHTTTWTNEEAAKWEKALWGRLDDPSDSAPD